MGASAKQLGIDRLSIDDRLTLVEEIWDSLLDEADLLAIPPSHIEELDRRLASRAANPESGSSWEEVKARLTSPGQVDR